MRISERGLKLIKGFESFRSETYDDLQPNKKITSQSQVIGTLTIGYGHTYTAEIGMKISKSQAEMLLLEDLEFAELSVKSNVKVEVTQSMYDALVSLVFNIGGHNFADKQYSNNSYVGSTLLKKLNEKCYECASARFGDFIRSKGQILDGLVSRRKKERALFDEAQYVQTYHFPQEGGITDGIVNDDVHLKKKGNSGLFLIILLILLKIFS